MLDLMPKGGVSGRAAARFVGLLEQLGEELAFRRGWKSAVADRLGVDQGHISRLLNGQRTTVGLDLLERAIKTLGLRCEYFFVRGPASIPFRQYIGAQHDGAPTSYPAVDRFAESIESKALSAEQLDVLRSIDFASLIPTPEALRVIALGLQMCGMREPPHSTMPPRARH